MENGQLSLVSMDKKRKVTSDIKPKRKWNKFENENSEANGKAIYCIFNGVNLSKFKRITISKYLG